MVVVSVVVVVNGTGLVVAELISLVCAELISLDCAELISFVCAELISSVCDTVDVYIDGRSVVSAVMLCGVPGSSADLLALIFNPISSMKSGFRRS